MSSQLIRARSGTIPELSADPSSPSPQQAWVLRSGSGGTGGGKITFTAGFGALMTKHNTGSSFSYQFSYETLEGTIKRVTLS